MHVVKLAGAVYELQGWEIPPRRPASLAAPPGRNSRPSGEDSARDAAYPENGDDDTPS